MQKKTSELLNEEICQRFGIDGLEFRGHFTEEEMVNQEGHILSDLAYMANTLKIKEDDIGLGGFHLTVSRIVGGETTHGAYFPNARVMATYNAFFDSSSFAPLYIGRITMSNCSPLAL